MVEQYTRFPGTYSQYGASLQDCAQAPRRDTRAVGNESSSSYSLADRWRFLSLESCENVTLSHSAWERVPLQ